MFKNGTDHLIETKVIHAGLPQNQQPTELNALHLCYNRPSRIELKTPSEWTKCSPCHLYCVTVIHQGIKVKAALLVITESFEMISGEKNRRLRECSKWLDLRPIFVSICLTDMRIKALYRAFLEIFLKSMLPARNLFHVTLIRKSSILCNKHTSDCYPLSLRIFSSLGSLLTFKPSPSRTHWLASKSDLGGLGSSPRPCRHGENW